MDSDNCRLSWRRRIFFWAILVLALIGFSLLSVEVILRLMYPEQMVNGTYWGRGAFEFFEPTGFRHAPGFKGRAYRQGVFDCPIEISEMGLRQRDVEFQRELPRRVLLLGDSFTFGLGVREESTFASLIQKPLNPLGIGVINGGQGGYSIAQEVKWGMRLAPKIKPELIVLCAFLINDIKDDYNQGHKQFEVKYGYRLYKGRWFPRPVFDFLRTHSYLIMYAGNIIHRRRGSSNGDSEFKKLAAHETERVMRPAFKALKTLQEYCKDNEIQLGVVMIPPRDGMTMFDVPFKNWLEIERIPVLDLRERGFTTVPKSIVKYRHGTDSGSFYDSS